MNKLITKLNEMDDKLLISKDCQVALGFLYDQIIVQPIEFYGSGQQKINKIYFVGVSEKLKLYFK